MKETRHVEIRAEQESKDLVIVGTPIVFEKPTTINDPVGSYVEVISRNALDDVNLNDTRLLYNHDTSKVPLARTPKTMAFSIDSEGLHMRAVLPNTETGRSVYESVKRGDLDGMSFAFTVAEDGSHYDARSNTRTISKIKRLYEVSLVPFPAYQGTSAEARSQMDAAKADRQTRNSMRIKINQIKKRSVI